MGTKGGRAEYAKIECERNLLELQYPADRGLKLQRRQKNHDKFGHLIKGAEKEISKITAPVNHKWLFR